MLGEVSLKNDEVGEGLSESEEGSWMDEVRRRFLSIRSLSTCETPALHQTMIFSQKSCKQEEFQ